MSGSVIVYVLTLLSMVGLLVYGLRRFVGAQKSVVPAIRRFLTQTGYRLPTAAGQDVESSVQHWVADWNVQKSQGRYDSLLVRDFNGLSISHRYLVEPEPNSRTRYLMSAWWRADVPCRVGFHIAERSFGGLGDRLLRMMTSTNRRFQAQYGVQIQSGNPRIDARFQIWGIDPVAVAHALRFPGLEQALLDLPEVDLHVGADGVCFNDPEQKNLIAGMGGTFGALSMAYDREKTLDISIAVHDKVSRLLLLATQAAQ